MVGRPSCNAGYIVRRLQKSLCTTVQASVAIATLEHQPPTPDKLIRQMHNVTPLPCTVFWFSCTMLSAVSSLSSGSVVQCWLLCLPYTQGSLPKETLIRNSYLPNPYCLLRAFHLDELFAIYVRGRALFWILCQRWNTLPPVCRPPPIIYHVCSRPCTVFNIMPVVEHASPCLQTTTNNLPRL